MKYTKLIAALFLASMLLLSGCGSTDTNDGGNEPSAPSAPSTPSEPSAPVVNSTIIQTINGESITVNLTANGLIFKGYEGKIVLLEVYGDTCPHCEAAIPHYNDIHARYPNDVVVIALESYGTLSNASQQQYITIPKANTGDMFSFIYSLTGYSTSQGVPYLMIYDRNGNFNQDFTVGADLDFGMVDSLIQGLL